MPTAVRAAQSTPPAQSPGAAARPCRLQGHVTSGELPLPGATVTARSGDRVVALSSTDMEGGYSVPLAPGTYTLRVELTAFAPIDRQVTLGTPPCEVTTDLKTQLLSRTPGAPPRPAPAAAANPPASGTPVQASAARQGGTGQAAADPQAGGRGGRGGARAGGPPRFQTLSVQQSAGATTSNEAVFDVTVSNRADDPAARLLPPGFSADAQTEAVTVNGTMVEVDRNQLNERIQALGRGEFALADGQLTAGGQPGFGAVNFGGEGQLGGLGGGLGGGGGRGGGGGIGGGLGGRGGGSGIQVNATYGFGGSALDASPYALRGESPQQRDYLQQNVTTTLGGPVRVPGIYNGTNRTTFNFSYSGARNGDFSDQYATVPGEAFRRGDFSASSVAIINPATGQPFVGNIIPSNLVSPTSLALMRFIPDANLSGDTRNYRNSRTSHSTTDSFSLRLTHSITTPQAGRGGRGGAAGAGGRAGGGGRAGTAGTTGAAVAAGRAGATGATGATGTGTTAPPSPAGTTSTAAGTASTAGTAAASPAGRVAQPGQVAQGGAGRGGQAGGGRGGAGGRGNFQAPLNITMNATVNYRRNSGDRLNVFPQLNGLTEGSTFSMPVTVNMRAGRSMHAFNGNFSRTQSTAASPFAFQQDIAGAAGITGVSSEPFDWGVPTLTFGTFTSLRDVTPNRRTDHSWNLGYTWSRPAGTHTYRMGGTYQQSVNDSQSNSNARGSFTFSGLYTANGQGTVRGSGQDFADFLLGMPQQATRQYSVSLDNISQSVALHGRQFGAYFQDDWRWKARWTINYGIQYDVVMPFTEASGHLVNLDANGDFTAVSIVEAGKTGAFNGQFPGGVVNPDWNNLAPRVGAAWRVNNRSVVRFGYGLSYNTGSYSTIARQLSQQPPYFLTGTSLGTLSSPLAITDPFANITGSTVTNSYGIEKNYQLGLINQWTADYNRDLFRTWNVGATYIGTRGARLDMLRAPNRGPGGLRIPDVQSFTWQSSEGSSYMNGVSFRVQKRQTRGISGNASYTLARARDNTTATGGGATVAQDDQNLDAEWALSSFDRRHQLSGSMNIELPWGRNRLWLSEGGWLSQLVGNWAMSTNLTWQSGAPTTARCSTCASDIARGTGGTLRANYTGDPIQLGDPTIDAFFNTAAFSIPASGTFGNSPRNLIIGPGSRQLNAQFTRDVALGGNRNVSINVNANNLLNLVNYGGLDTNVNSQTFGQITSVRGMRTLRVNLRFRF
jgi:hypothetical protein